MKLYPCQRKPHLSASLPAWGVRVEIPCRSRRFARTLRHSPHGECGLKYTMHIILAAYIVSLPAWGVRVEMQPPNVRAAGTWSLPAWGVRVEISSIASACAPITSLPAWGVRVEIYHVRPVSLRGASHSPHGECGLKFRRRRPDAAPCERHSPHGECGLKSTAHRHAPSTPGHSPHGECGLKLVHNQT